MHRRSGVLHDAPVVRVARDVSVRVGHARHVPIVVGLELRANGVARFGVHESRVEAVRPAHCGGLSVHGHGPGLDLVLDPLGRVEVVGVGERGRPLDVTRLLDQVRLPEVTEVRRAVSPGRPVVLIVAGDGPRSRTVGDSATPRRDCAGLVREGLRFEQRLVSESLQGLEGRFTGAGRRAMHERRAGEVWSVHVRRLADCEGVVEVPGAGSDAPVGHGTASLEHA